MVPREVTFGAKFNVNVFDISRDLVDIIRLIIAHFKAQIKLRLMVNLFYEIYF